MIKVNFLISKFTIELNTMGELSRIMASDLSQPADGVLEEKFNTDCNFGSVILPYQELHRASYLLLPTIQHFFVGLINSCRKYCSTPLAKSTSRGRLRANSSFSRASDPTGIGVSPWKFYAEETVIGSNQRG